MRLYAQPVHVTSWNKLQWTITAGLSCYCTLYFFQDLVYSSFKFPNRILRGYTDLGMAFYRQGH